MQVAIHPRFIPPPFQHSVECRRITLRDGATATIRPVRPTDSPDLERFFRELSPESRYRRFLSATVPDSNFIARVVEGRQPESAFTLVVVSTVRGAPRIVATGSYLARDMRTAELAVAVADASQGHGLGTLLLEHLASIAVLHGFKHFWALIAANNAPMMELIRESGFEVHERYGRDGVEIDIVLAPSRESVQRLETRDRIATVASLKRFFAPHSVAVVGASRKIESVGYRTLEGLLRSNYTGHVFAVNPNASEVAGVKSYPSVRDLPEGPDLAVIAVPAAAVMGVVDDCAVRGVRALVVLTAGFAESGRDGAASQTALVEKVRGYGMRMIGPNCLGLLNADPAVRLNASFAPIFPPAGRIALSSQSGAVGLAALGAAAQYGLGFSTFVSVGNKADVSGNDLLQYWEEDPNTDVILLYLESFGNPRRFAPIARRVCRRKPIVALHSGLTRAGGRAAGSHTAALASSATTVDALFRQTGVIRTGSLEEMFELAQALGTQPLPMGSRVAIVTNAGGLGVLCTDTCDAAGLTVDEPSPQLRERLAALLPHAASIGNPIDLIAAAGPGEYQASVEALLTSGEYDSLIVHYTPVGLAGNEDVKTAIVKAIARARAAGAAERPVLACLMNQEQPQAHLIGGNERVPCYSFPETPARVLGKMLTYAKWRSLPEEVFPDFDDLELEPAHSVCRTATSERGECWLSAEESWAVLEAAQLPLSPVAFARTADEAVHAAATIGFPVAVKLASRQFVHKTEVEGVRLHLKDAQAVRHKFEEIAHRVDHEHHPDAMDGVVVQQMMAGGVELMVGVALDPLFGPLVAFGLGGVHVEVLSDVGFRIAPLSTRDAAELVRGIRGFRLLEGYRSHPPADLDAIEELLLRVSRLVEEVPEIAEIDLNPVYAFPPGQGCLIADVRVRVRPRS
jgi:acetate---CoA ligase (ADP-forming)